MAFEQRDNSGVMWPNEQKFSDRSPDMSGKGVIDGVEKKIAAWWKKSTRGGPDYLSIAFKDPQELAGSTQPSPQQNQQQQNWGNNSTPQQQTEQKTGGFAEAPSAEDDIPF